MVGIGAHTLTLKQNPTTFISVTLDYEAFWAIDSDRDSYSVRKSEETLIKEVGRDLFNNWGRLPSWRDGST